MVMNMSSVAQAYLFVCAKKVVRRGKRHCFGNSFVGRLVSVTLQEQPSASKVLIACEITPIQLSAWISYLSGDERELGEKRTLKKV